MATLVTGPNQNIQGVQIPDQMSDYARLLTLKQAIQEAPMRQQMLQQQVQQTQMQNQQMQRAQQDDQNFRTAMQDPSNQGMTIGQLTNKLAQTGGIGPDAYLKYMQQDRLARTEMATLDDKNATNLKNAYANTQPLFDNWMKMSDQQIAQDWPKISSQYHAIWDPIVRENPQFQGRLATLDPNKPITHDQLAELGSGMGMAQAYADEDAKRRKEQQDLETGSVDLQIKRQQLERGGTSDIDKFTSDYLKSNNLDNTPQNRQKAFQEYTRQTKIAPAQVRVEGMAQTREMPVIDTKSGNALQYLSAADINTANKTEPGRYIPASEGGKALQKTATIEDIRGNIQSVRQNLQNPKMPEFTADQRAEIAIAMGKPDTQGALSAAFRGGVLGSLTPEQQDYLINLGQLKENAMAMRSVLGAGQGSQDLRDAITATIPGPRTPSKAYAAKQLDAFENVLNRVEKGVPKVPLAGGSTGNTPNTGNQQSGPLKITTRSGNTITIE